MFKKLLLNKNQLHSLKESLEKSELSTKLRPFIYDKVKIHMTSLGDNKAFPPEEDVPFDYKVLKDRFIEIVDIISKIDTLESYDETYLANRLSKLVNECKQIEEAIRPNLEKICLNVILQLFEVPNDTVDIEAKLVDKVDPENMFRIKPEPSSKRKFQFDDLIDFKDANKSVLKRRLINSLIQGAAYTYSTEKSLYIAEIYKIDKRLIPLYEEIIAINDYLLFIKEENITDKNPMQGSCVEVMLGNTFRDKTKIKAQGIIFPFLLHELVKGFMELFASHGLPEDDDKAKYIISQADFIIAEPWDLRMGVKLWEYISKHMEDTRILPYFFRNLCCLPTKEFNLSLREIFAETNKGQHILKHMFNNAEEEMNEQGFVSNMDLKNSQITVISDDISNNSENLTEGEEDEPSPSTLLHHATIDDIEFEAQNGMINNMYDLNIYVNGKLIVIDNLLFACEDKSNISPNAYQLHISIPQELREKGIATKLYKCFLLKVGDIISLFSNRISSYAREENKEIDSDRAIDNILAKIVDEMPNADIDMLNTEDGKPLGYIVYLDEIKTESTKTYGELIQENNENEAIYGLPNDEKGNKSYPWQIDYDWKQQDIADEAENEYFNITKKGDMVNTQNSFITASNKMYKDKRPIEFKKEIAKRLKDKFGNSVIGKDELEKVGFDTSRASKNPNKPTKVQASIEKDFDITQIGQSFAHGNAKLSADILIINLTTAVNCPSDKKGLCSLSNVCFAKKAERQYPDTLKNNLRNEIMIPLLSIEEFIKYIEDHIRNCKYKTNYIRFNESGDFESQEMVDRCEKVSEFFYKEYGIQCSCYTCRTDLDFTKCKYMIVNGSSIKVKGADRYYFGVSDKKFNSLPDPSEGVHELKNGDMFFKCMCNCRRCKFCYNTREQNGELDNRPTKVYCKIH